MLLETEYQRALSYQRWLCWCITANSKLRAHSNLCKDKLFLPYCKSIFELQLCTHAQEGRQEPVAASSWSPFLAGITSAPKSSHLKLSMVVIVISRLFGRPFLNLTVQKDFLVTPVTT